MTENQSHPVTIAASAIGANQELADIGILFSAHAIPPAPDAFHRKCRRVMIASDVPTLVFGQIVDAIRNGFAKARAIWGRHVTTS